MTSVVLELSGKRDRLGLKGPRAAEWLLGQGVVLPTAPNTWNYSPVTSATDTLLVARLGTGEFFLEAGAAGTSLAGMFSSLNRNPPGVYPVLREDCGLRLQGEAVHEVLAQVCNVNFAPLSLEAHPLLMTLMIGVAVLVVPENTAGGRRYRIWCDPTFGPYLAESLGAVVIECDGIYTGVPA